MEHVFICGLFGLLCMSISCWPIYEFLHAQGLIDREEGNNIEALRNLQKALDLNSKSIETYKEIGKTL